ncbi:MAG: glycosyltransferase family 39 protein [bacterium]
MERKSRLRLRHRWTQRGSRIFSLRWIEARRELPREAMIEPVPRPVRFRSSSPTPRPAQRPSAAAPSVPATTLALVALALVLRLLFWQATADRGWPDSAAYQGDAAMWTRWAEAIRDGIPFENGLPLRPPGAAYLIAALSGDGPLPIARLKLAWCVLASLTVGLVHAAVRRSFGPDVGLAVGVLLAGSTGWMILATSLDNETPYLTLVATTWVLWPAVVQERGAAALAAWAALHALACLVRAEHVLYLALLFPCLAVAWRAEGQRRGRRSLAGVGVSLAVFVLVLAPWHWHAWAALHRLNHGPVQLEPGARRMQEAMERRLAGVRWEPEATAELETLPAVSRDTARLFIGATHWVRGESVVAPPALAILADAFGAVPRPLPAHPFVACYGGLNFALANDARAPGGFARGPLDDSPPLVGGADRYPLALVQGLPPASLSLTYPPHLRLLADGYRVGWESIRADPARFLVLAATKLGTFWKGATLGLGGWNLPLGLSGTRAPVDLVVPRTTFATTAWRLAVLVLAGLGLALARPRAALAPWLAYLASKIVVTVAFFGYARFGATVIPVIALLASLGVAGLVERVTAVRAARPRRLPRWPVCAAALAMALVAAEAIRWQRAPTLSLGERRVTATEPFPPDDPRDLLLRVGSADTDRPKRAAP